MKFVDSVNIDNQLDGLTTYVVPTKIKDVITIAGSMLGGAVYSKENNPRLSSITVSMLDKGTVDKSKYDISNILESIGAEISFISSNHHINFSAHCLRQDLPVVVELLTEQLRTPEFSPDELTLLKKRVIANLERSKEDTKKQALIGLLEHLYPIRHINYKNTIEESIEFVNSVNLSDIKKYHQTTFGLGSINIIAAGDVPSEKFTGLVNNSFKDWGTQKLVELDIHADANKRKHATGSMEIKDKTSSDIYIGQTVNITEEHEDYYDLMMGIYILGGNFSARLMQTVRDKEGLTYGIGSSMSGCSYGVNGHWYTWGTFAPKLVDQGIKSTMEQIKQWYENGITEKELAAKKTTLSGLFKVSLDTTSGLVDKLLSNAEKNRKLRFLDEYHHKINDLDHQSINQSIKRHIDIKKLTTSIAGSKA